MRTSRGWCSGQGAELLCSCSCAGFDDRPRDVSHSIVLLASPSLPRAVASVWERCEIPLAPRSRVPDRDRPTSPGQRRYKHLPAPTEPPRLPRLPGELLQLHRQSHLLQPRPDGWESPVPYIPRESEGNTYALILTPALSVASGPLGQARPDPPHPRPRERTTDNRPGCSRGSLLSMTVCNLLVDQDQFTLVTLFRFIFRRSQASEKSFTPCSNT